MYRSSTVEQTGDVRSTVIHFEICFVPRYRFVLRVNKKLSSFFATCEPCNLYFGTVELVNYKIIVLWKDGTGVKRELKSDGVAKESNDFCPTGNCVTRRKEMCVTYMMMIINILCPVQVQCG